MSAGIPVLVSIPVWSEGVVNPCGRIFGWKVTFPDFFFFFLFFFEDGADSDSELLVVGGWDKGG